MRRAPAFCGHRDPVQLGATEVTAFPSSSAIRGQVAAATQRQALVVLLFLYREVRGEDLSWFDGLMRAKVLPDSTTRRA